MLLIFLFMHSMMPLSSGIPLCMLIYVIYKSFYCKYKVSVFNTEIALLILVKY